MDEPRCDMCEYADIEHETETTVSFTCLHFERRDEPIGYVVSRGASPSSCPIRNPGIKAKAPDYQGIATDIAKLVKDKQAAYGDSFGRAGNVLREMYPNGIQPNQYNDLLTITRILDKLFRIANDKDAFNENPYTDIVGYGLLGAGRNDGSR